MHEIDVIADDAVVARLDVVDSSARAGTDCR